jgi:BirA family biotin operon repressor/biotin-[acetyl-CoA-carboxylase] ligase
MQQTGNLDTIAPIERFEVVDSTALLAARLVRSGEIGEHARFLIAETQTGGVGRFGRAWESPRGGVWCTRIWPLTLNPARVLDGLGLRTGLAAVHALGHTLAAHGHGERVGLKWPNDLLLGGRKIGGVLCEAIRQEGRTYVLASAGINANIRRDALSDSIKGIATTIFEETGAAVNIHRLEQDLRTNLCDALQLEGLSAGQLQDLRDHLHGAGQNATVTLPDRSTLQGVIVGLSDEGSLVVRTTEKDVTLPSGSEFVLGQ